MRWPTCLGPVTILANQDDWTTPPAGIALAPQEIHLWRANLNVEPEAAAALTNNLSLEETVRAGRFRAKEDGLHFAVCRGILRQLLSAYLQQPAADVVIAASKTKKPFVRIDPPEPSVCFNLSHSRGLAVFAFAQSLELGIDIEYFREIVQFEDIAERYFSDRERAEILSANPADRPNRFFQCWTLKEAYLKAIGEGLPLLDSLEAPSSSASSGAQDSRVWSQYAFVPSSAYAGALVAEGTGHHLRVWAWNDEKTAS